MIDFVISAGVRWWSHWKLKDESGILPSEKEVTGSYPHHAIMIHLSRLVEHQLIARKIVENAWDEMKVEWKSFDIEDRLEHPFMKSGRIKI